jgi:hypothetical protein
VNNTSGVISSVGAAAEKEEAAEQTPLMGADSRDPGDAAWALMESAAAKARTFGSGDRAFSGGNEFVSAIRDSFGSEGGDGDVPGFGAGSNAGGTGGSVGGGGGERSAAAIAASAAASAVEAGADAMPSGPEVSPKQRARQRAAAAAAEKFAAERAAAAALAAAGSMSSFDPPLLLPSRIHPLSYLPPQCFLL